MQPLKITRNEIPLLLKGICLGVLLMVPVLLIFVFHVVHTSMFIFLVVCIFISVCVWTFKAFVVINIERQIISEGYQVLGVAFLTTYKTSFTGFEKIFINYITSGVAYDVIDGDPHNSVPTYKVFLKTNEGEKFCIVEGISKKKVRKRVTEISSILNVEVYDNTVTRRSEFYTEDN